MTTMAGAADMAVDRPTADTRHRGRFGLWLALIAGTGLVARVAYVLTIGRHLTLGLDAVWYELQSGTIAAGKGYIDPATFYRSGRSVPTANFPPLWPMTLAVAHRLTLRSQTSYQLVGAAIGTVSVVLTGLVGRRVAGGRIGLVAAGLVACCPLLIAADGSLMSESLYVALVAAALLASYWALDAPRVPRFALVGLLVGLAALTRSDGIFLAPILAVGLAWRVRTPSMGRKVLLGLCLLGVVVAVQAPWVVRNTVRMGGLVTVSSDSGSMLEGANCPAAYGGSEIGYWVTACSSQARAPGTSERQWSARSRAAGLHYARTHLGRLAVVVPARVLRVWGLWSPVPQARLESVESRDLHWQLVGWGYDLAMLVAALPGTVLLIRRRATLVPLAAVSGGGDRHGRCLVRQPTVPAGGRAGGSHCRGHRPGGAGARRGDPTGSGASVHVTRCRLLLSELALGGGDHQTEARLSEARRRGSATDRVKGATASAMSPNVHRSVTPRLLS